MDREERDRLIVEHLWVPETVADKLIGRMPAIEREELVGAATEALVRAAEAFDPKKTAKFSSFAFICCYRKAKGFIEYNRRRAKIQYECVPILNIDEDQKRRNNNNVEGEIENEEFLADLRKKVLEEFKGRDRYIASEFFVKGRRKSDLAREFGISSQAVSQVVARLRVKLCEKIRTMKEDYYG